MEMIRVSSSAISATVLRRMQVTFKQGKNYDFCNVPQLVFERFLCSISKGHFYVGLA
jgi:hypothetical protein